MKIEQCTNGCENCILSLKQYEDCLEFCDTRSIGVVKDRGNNVSQWIFDNTQAKKCMCLLRVDDCVIKDKQILKCDYLMLVCDKNEKSAFFIELKGSDFGRALEQCTETMKKLQRYLGGFCLYARIAMRKVPNIKNLSADTKKNQTKLISLLKKHNKIANYGLFDYKSNQYKP